MTTPELGSEILPTDSRGRVRVARERREQLLDEFERSGMTGAQFARSVGLKYQTFAFWRQQRQRSKPVVAGGQGSHKAASVAWLETVLTDAQKAVPSSATMLVVRLPSGAAVEVSNVSQAPMAAALLRAWEKTPC
jgi:hypothetical protein